MSSVNNLSKTLNNLNTSSLTSTITNNKSLNLKSTTTTQQQQQPPTTSSIVTRKNSYNNINNGNESMTGGTTVMVTRSPIKLSNITTTTTAATTTAATTTTAVSPSSSNITATSTATATTITLTPTINVVTTAGNSNNNSIVITSTQSDINNDNVIVDSTISKTTTTSTATTITISTIETITTAATTTAPPTTATTTTTIPATTTAATKTTTTIPTTINDNKINGTQQSTTTATTTTTINHNNTSGINTNSHININSTNKSSSNYPHPHSSSTFSLNKNEEFHFIKPSECPVFKPNEEEFKNPLAYIGKIRPFAEKYGIAKIQPPKSWTPPFTVDVDKLKFTPRVQRLNELEAKTRVKLNFLDQIAKFWELQGSSLKIPMVERKALDLYSLHRIVQEEGGIEQTTKERKWSRIANRMGYPSGKSIGAILKGHYERILHPFDIFTSGKAIDIKLETEIDDKDYKPHGIVSRQQISPPNETTARRSKRFANSNASKESACGLGGSSNNNLSTTLLSNNLTGNLIVSSATTTTTTAAAATTAASLLTTTTTPSSTTLTPTPATIKDEIKDDLEYKQRIYNNNQKILLSGCGGRMNRSRMAASYGNLIQQHQQMKKKDKDIDPLAKYICHICNRGDSEENMLLCDGCDDSYHTFCLIPPLNDIPKGDWRCPKCVVEEVNKPTEAFGFEQAQREYTLQQFGEMADQFKADYFNMSVHLVPTELVEREFWRIVSSIDEDVTVEYGADLHTMDHGSGFPTKSSLYLLPGDQEYAESSWNLNNLPLLEESILGHINADISGMKVPWMYVGMCFATFCWHNEDHWSYSINYLHWGEPKTWYGVPGYKAEQFEATMKMAAPELFQSQPDLLHQLVTIMNPNILMNNNVPVYRTDQHAGEFVITFPRAYHAGFNQGYNFAEAVNFAPADWMKMGRECINHYSMLRRFCVFSHDELVCKMALEPDKLNLGIATACYLDMAEMVDTEKKLRKSLLEWGVTKADREAFELIPDDERQCDSCKTTCFLSAVTCQCTKNLVCLRHYTELCNCIPDKHTLKYRYTLDELPLMLKKLKIKAESFENWLSKVRDVLDPTTQTTITLIELKNLTKEANDLKFPSSIILERLNSAVLEAEKCVTVIQQLDINKMRTRNRNNNKNDTAKYKLTMDELDLFVQEINNLCCIIQEGQSVRELQKLGKEFIQNSKQLLLNKLNKINIIKLQQLIDDGQSLCIELNEINLLKIRLEQANWYNRYQIIFNDNNTLIKSTTTPTPITTTPTPTSSSVKNHKIQLNDLKLLLKDGLEITPDPYIEKELINIQELILTIEDWEEVAKKCFESGTQHELPEIELLLDRATDIIGELPSELALRDAVKKSKEWLSTVEILQSNENYPYFHTLENVVNCGKNIPFQLEELKRMEEHLNSAKLWKEKTSKTFLKKQTKFHLMDVLSPRLNAIMLDSNYNNYNNINNNINNNKKKLILEEQFTEDMGPVQMVNQFKQAEEKEIHDMINLRKINLIKIPTIDKYCVCKRKFNGYMYNCQLCKDWFHENCVPIPKTTVRPRLLQQQSSTTTPATASSSLLLKNLSNNDNNVIQLSTSNNNSSTTTTTELTTTTTAAAAATTTPTVSINQTLNSSSIIPPPPQLNIRERDSEIKYLCPSCMRSRRPRLETILSLLVSLQRLPIRLPEGEALQCLTERAMNWQDRARQAFATKDIASALASLSLLSQKNNNNNNNDNNKNIIQQNLQTIDLKKKLKTNKKHQQQQQQQLIKTTLEEDDIDSSSDDEFRPLHIQEDDDIQSDNIISTPTSPMKIEHAYSILTSSSTIIKTKTNDININDNNLTTDQPLIQLNKNTREFLEDLMMEGDLLEVSLDETLHIWRILNAAKSSTSDLANLQYKYNIISNTNDNLVNNAKKRRSDDHVTTIPTKKTTRVNNLTLNSTITTGITTTTTTIITTTTTSAAAATTTTAAATLSATQQHQPIKVKRGRKMKIITKETDNTDTLLIQETTINQINKIDTSTSINPQSNLNNNSNNNNSNSNNNTEVLRNNQIEQINSPIGQILSNNGTTTTTTATTTTTTTTKKRKRGTAANKKLNQSSTTSHQDQLSATATAASTSDDDEECSAPNCARPSGREVDWVQCDGGCNKWFHMFCVGLDKNQIKPDDDYICKRCTKKSNNLNNKQQQQQKSITTTTTNPSLELNSNNNNNDLIISNCSNSNSCSSSNNSNSSCSGVGIGDNISGDKLSSIIINNIELNNIKNSIADRNLTNNDITSNNDGKK